MNAELTFRLSIALIGVALAAIRLHYMESAIQSGEGFFRPARDARQFVFGTLGILIILPVVIYVFAPGWLAWAALPVLPGLRWFGVALGVVSIALLWWVHRTLGQNFAVPGVTKASQTLVIEGPYRWARHPMYTTLFLISLSYFFISANWLIGVGWLIWITGTVATMVGDEELTLIEKFGDEYRAYMRHTARFLPGVF